MAAAVPLALLPLTSTHAGRLMQNKSPPNLPSVPHPVTATMDVHLGYPATAQDLLAIEEKLQEAGRAICDATDGGVLITDFFVARNGYSAGHADMFIYPQSMFSQAAVSGTDFPFGEGRFLTTPAHYGPGVWAHEFGHLLFGLKDQYENQTFNDHCGIGRSVDPVDEFDNSIMQSYGSWCYDPSELLNELAYTTTECTDSSDCGVGFACGATAPYFSEFNVSSNFHEDLVDSGFYPGPRGGEELWLDLDIGASISTVDWQTSSAIWFVEADGPDAWFYDIRVEALADGSNVLLRATLQEHGKAEVEPLAWNIGAEVKLAFGSYSGCGDNGGSAAEVTGVFGASLNGVSLIIPAELLGAAGATDIELPVHFDETCKIQGSSDYKVRTLNFDEAAPDPGTLDGSVVGARKDVNSDAVFLQLGDCGYYPSNRFSVANQRWEASQQWVDVEVLVDELFADTECVFPGNLGQCCNAGTCNSPDWMCVQDTCVDPDCDPLLEPETCGRHLLEVGSDWEFMQYNLQYGWPQLSSTFQENLDLSEFVPSTKPTPSPKIGTTDCVVFTPHVHTDIAASDTVAVVLDHSLSMEDAWSFGGTATKLNWAKKALNKYAAELAETATTRMALRKFNHKSLTPEFTFKTVEQDIAPNQTLTEIDLEGIEEELEGIEPQGNTAIGDAIVAALSDLAIDDALTPGTNNSAIFLITDGAQNTGNKGVCEAMDEAADEGVPVYVAPIGNFKEDGFKCVEGTGGKLLGAVRDSELPGALYEMRADFAGQQLSLAYERSVISGPMGGYAPTKTYDILVEPYADALTVLLTPDSDHMDTWALEFTLSGPLGESITELHAGYLTYDPDGYYISVRVPTPSAGKWELELAAPDLPSKLEPEVQTVMARVEHEGPRCDARVLRPLIESHTQAATIRAFAAWNHQIADGVSFSATVRDRSGTEWSVPMTVDEDGSATGTFDSYTSDGLYLVRVECEVADGSSHIAGETAEGAATDTTAITSGFKRVQTTTFMLDAGLYPPPTGDCDEDGVPDSLEGEGDADGDGIPDYCDEDTDGDDIPDMYEGVGDDDLDGLMNMFDIDADGDGEHDGLDDDPSDPLSHLRYAVGDVDGDGLEDRVWGEPDVNSGRGQIKIMYGDNMGPHTWHLDGPGIVGIAADDDHFGAAIAVGDFNGDGFDDVASGAPDADHSGLTDTGTVNIIYGSTGGLTSIGDQQFHTDSTGIKGIAESDERFASRLSVGDFNCDGFVDLVIGVPEEAVGAATDSGIVHVLYGSTGGVSAVDDLWYQGNSGVNGTVEAGDRFGDSLAVGDFDADSCDDLVIGAPGQSWGTLFDVGDAYVMYGDLGGLTTTGDWTIMQGIILGTLDGGELFATRTWAEDRNGDGFDDLLIMSPGDPCAIGEKGFNEVFGGASGLSSSGSTWACEVHRD